MARLLDVAEYTGFSRPCLFQQSLDIGAINIQMKAWRRCTGGVGVVIAALHQSQSSFATTTRKVKDIQRNWTVVVSAAANVKMIRG